MAIKESIMNIQDKLEAMLKKRRYKKANKERNALVEERMEYLECAGKLNEALSQFRTTIRTQAINIKQGEAFHRDTRLQEDQLWDAAIGYMLVQDAQYAMKTLFNYDSIQYAYDLMQGVTKYMNGGKAKFARVPGVRKDKERNAAGYLTSDHLLEEKEAFLETFFEELKRTGDIEKCMATARRPADVEGGRRFGSGGSSGSGGNALRQSIRAAENQPTEDYVYELDPNSVDIHAPEEYTIAAGNALRDALVQEPAAEEAVEGTAVLETMEGTV